MWKLLNTGSKICLGDKIRYHKPVYGEKVFTVIKTEQHYIEVAPEPDDQCSPNNTGSKVIRYFDIGYSIGLEVWE